MKLFIVTVILVILVALKMPRKRTGHELLATIQFALLMNFITDLYLDLKYKLYWYFDKEQIEWFYLAIALGVIAVLVVIFNYFPLNSNFVIKLIYILGWTCILVLLELYAVYIKVLHYGEWNIIYCAMVYFFSRYILYFVLDYTADRRESHNKVAISSSTNGALTQ